MFVCKVCKEKYSTLEGLYSHLEEEHSSLIPPNMTTAHYYYYLKTGRKHGNCVMCKEPTKFNEKTKKYHRFCDNPKCKQDYKEIVDKRMIGVYGKVNLLNDPEQQRKMLMNRSISGHYNFNGVDKPYVGSYELDFLKTMDLFFDWDPNDIVSPSPHTYYYEYEGVKHFYIPDFYIMSLGLEIEVKDGGDNPNMHHKIQDVDKEKEKLKDKVMHTQKINHYVKLTNKNYYNLFEFFRISKEYVEKYGDYEKIPKIILDEDIRTKKVVSKNQIEKEVNKAINENYEPVNERYGLDKFLIWFEKPISKLKNGNIRLYHGSSVDIKEKIITPISINVGATRMSTPRWSTYFWDNLEMAIQWAITWKIQETMNTRCLYRNHDGKSLLVNNTNLSDEKFIDKILKAKPIIYIYETVVPIKKLEMGSTATIPEYTVSETVKIVKKTKIKVDRNMIYTYFTIISRDEFNKIPNRDDVDYISRYRNRLVSLFLDDRRDPYRYMIERDMTLNKIKIGDDISHYRRKINDAMDVNLLGLNESSEIINLQEESYVCFPLLNSIISSKYTDVKSKAQYRKDVESFKHHFLQGIKDIKSLDDAKAMKSDLVALNSYLHDIKYTNKYSEFKNITAVKEIEGWMNNTAIPQIDQIIKKYEKNIEPVNEYAHTITFALNNKLNRGLYGLMDSVSSIIIDGDIQIQRRNGIMSITESVELNDNTNNITFGTDADIKLKKDNVSYLIWNRNQGEDILLENFIKDWLLPVNIDSFHRIEGGED